MLVLYEIMSKSLSKCKGLLHYIDPKLGFLNSLK
jgi:hypothetical protein